jgi:hypothetical protein
MFHLFELHIAMLDPSPCGSTPKEKAVTNTAAPCACDGQTDPTPATTITVGAPPHLCSGPTILEPMQVVEISSETDGDAKLA